jgi:hypothetical protein
MTVNRRRLFAASDVVEAGDWRAEVRNDELAEISYRGIPVLRGIRAVVRDRDWQTLVPVVQGRVHVPGVGGHSVLLDVEFEGFGCRYTAKLAFIFSAQGLEVAFHGEAPEAFQSNRIGLVVLHRPDDAGRLVVIENTGGGGGTALRFPVDISPHQPFQDVGAMQWQRDGANFRLDFSGDVFETEDQRNWTDASFKTYSRPLALPFPMDVPAGGRIGQTITLTASMPAGKEPEAPVQITEALTVSTDAASVVPALSLSAATEPCQARLPASCPGLESLLVELVAGSPAVADQAREAVDQAKVLNVPLDVRLNVENPDQISALLRLIPAHGVIRLGVFNSTTHVTEPYLWDALKAAAESSGFTGTLIAGARSHFAELNRNAHVIPYEAESLTYSITPQMHATEVPHMVESLPMQRLTARNALGISHGRPLLIGPVSLKPRFNAVATSAGDEGTAVKQTADPLQTDPFTAAWLLGSIAALSIPGVEGISYFETVGPRGISTSAGLTPAGELLTALAVHRGRNVLQTRGTPHGLVLYPVQTDDGIILFAANLTQEPINEVVQLPYGGRADLVLEPWTVTIHHAKTEGSST